VLRRFAVNASAFQRRWRACRSVGKRGVWLHIFRRSRFPDAYMHGGPRAQQTTYHEDTDADADSTTRARCILIDELTGVCARVFGVRAVGAKRCEGGVVLGLTMA
jgi:hypothetical protein